MSTAIQNPETVDDACKIIIDEDIQIKSKGLFNKTMSGKMFLSMWGGEQDDNKNTLLRQAQKNFLKSYSIDPSTATPLPLKLPSDDLANKLYSFQTNENKTLSKKIDRKTFNECYKCLNNLYAKSLQSWLTLDELKKLFLDAAKELYSNSKLIKDSAGEIESIIPDFINEELDTLHDLISTRKVEIHVGHAGCGKSTDISTKCLKSPNSKSVIVSLSNTICNMFKQKVPRISTCSCSKSLVLFEVQKDLPDLFTDADIIIIDEFSQWGFEWLPLLNKILSCNHNADFYIMGDVDQIPTFLSSGSLLYSLMQEFPNKTIQHNTQYRFANIPEYRELVDDILNSKIKPNTVMHELSTVVLKNTDCFICGANVNVDYVNAEVVKERFNLDLKQLGNNTLFKLVHLTDGDIPLISNATTSVNGCRIFRNTRYTVDSISDKTVVLKSLVDKSLVLCKQWDIDKYFKLAYAITVNKAQGLEWENVCCYITSIDGNLKNYNALYVALTRGKQNIIIATDTNGNGMSVQDLQNILNIKYKFYNNFIE